MPDRPKLGERVLDAVLALLCVVLFGAAFGIWCYLVFGAYQPAHAHDIYTGLQKDGTYGPTSPCCGGDDCEGVAEVDLQMHPDGSVSFFSRRHKVSVLVAAERVIPVGLPPDNQGKVWAGTWCGSKRTPNYVPYGYGDRPAGQIGEVTKPTADQPDPTFVTFCAFVAPGGA